MKHPIATRLPSLQPAARLVVAASAALWLAACASTPPPNAEIAVSTAAVANAAGAGAPELAPVEMRNARDKLERAKVAMAAEDNMTARRLAQQSLADAQWAEAKADAAKARKAAESLQEANRVLREEMSRSATK